MADRTYEEDGKKYRFSEAWADHEFSAEPCARCGHLYNNYPARSRRDNSTPLCSECGRQEAFEDMRGVSFAGKPYWRVREPE